MRAFLRATARSRGGENSLDSIDCPGGKAWVGGEWQGGTTKGEREAVAEGEGLARGWQRPPPEVDLSCSPFLALLSSFAPSCTFCRIPKLSCDLKEKKTKEEVCFYF